MTRETFLAVLARTPGVENAKSRFVIAEGHEVTFYLGRPGQAMQVTHVESCEPHAEFLEVRTRDPKGALFVLYDDLHVVASRPPREGATRRPGF